MGYYIDLKAISIDEYQETLKAADLLPSHMILKDELEENFMLIKKQKIENVEELRSALRSKTKLQDFSGNSGISEYYLKILIRNVNGYRQKPNTIKDFPGVPDDVVLNPQTAKEILLFCYRNRIPFVGPSEAWVKGGALYALDRDYTDLGMQCGEMAVSLLNGSSPSSIGVEAPHKITYFINLKTARYMKVDIDKSLLASAKGVY